MMQKKICMALSLLCMLMLLLPGCGNSEEPTKVENVALSNVKFSDSQMSGDAKKRLSEVEALLKTLSLSKSADMDAILTGVNTLPYDLELQLYLYEYDTGEALIGSRGTASLFWECNQQINLTEYLSYSSTGSLKISARYAFDGTYYQTDLFPVNLEGAASHSTEIHSESLPYTFTVYPEWGEAFKYTLMEITPPTGYSSYWYLCMRKDAGKDNASDSINYRILDEDGHVWSSGTLSACMKVGETALIELYAYDLAPGSYYLELNE